MQLEKLYPGDFLQLDPIFESGRLILPFYGSHSRGKEQFLAAVKAGTAYQTEAYGYRFYLTVNEEVRHCLTVTNLLVAPIDDALLRLGTNGQGELTWRRLLEVLETTARSRFVAKLVLAFTTTASNQEWLTAQGYQAVAEGFEKSLTYRTGLVLGGGGARGAYQIGVWEALQELQIPLQVVTGASVGALNGGLILVGDVAAAKELWLAISTDQVLQFPRAASDNHSLTRLLQQVQSLTITALRENGASTEPLEQLIYDALDEEKMQASPAELYVCTTHLPDFTEKVVHFDKNDCAGNLQWLIASASFYPAMKAKEIAGNYYIDGGYRNNLPVDVALAQEVSELIVVDVNGPGFIKRTPIPETVATVPFDSPWTLGSFLVFDRERSRINYQLGYLETMKHFGRGKGYWYTFSEEEEAALNKVWRRFCRRLQQTDDPLWQLIKGRPFWSRLNKAYQSKVVFETAGSALAELCGGLLNVPPEKYYEAAEFLPVLKKACNAQAEPIEGVLSVAEWLRQYRERLLAISDTRQLLYWQRSFTAKTPITAALRQLLELTPVTAVAGAFLAELLATSTKSDEVTHS